MKNKPLVSIITPTLNSGRFITDNIRSIRSQTYPRIEHIIVDGGSSDDTLNIIRELDPGAVVISEPDKGISDAFNKGIRNASGDIIATLNSDDYYVDNQVIQKVVNVFMRDRDVKFVYGKVKRIDSKSGKALFVYGQPFFSGGKDVLESISHPALFIAKEVYDTIGHYSLEYKCAMDYDFFLRVTEFFKPYYFDEIMTIMRWGGFSTKNMFLSHRELYRILRANGVSQISASVDLVFRYIITALSLALQKMRLGGLVLFYRKLRGQR